MSKSAAQQERSARRRGVDSSVTPAQPVRDEPEPLADTDYTRAGGEELTVPEDVTTATGLVEWVRDTADDQEREARAKAARYLNDSRSKPWSTVSAEVDGILG